MSLTKKLQDILSLDTKKLLVAVSGGADSVALLRLLAECDLDLETAHFDHALRETSKADAEFVKSLSTSLSIPFHTERADVGKIAKEKGWNLEDGARRLRYSFLTRVAKRINADAIVTAHTLDDQVETVLMQLLRGAAYLKGMPVKQGHIIRPLLAVSKSELLAYLRQIGQDYQTDESNFDTRRTRAWLRFEVLPLLEIRYPAIKQSLARLAEVQNEHAYHFEELAKELIHVDKNVKNVNVSTLLKQDAALQREVISRLINSGVSFEHIEEIRENLLGSTPLRISLPNRQVARLAYGQLDVFSHDWSRTGFSKRAFEAQNDILHIGSDVDFEKLKSFPNLVIRSRQAGDRIRLPAGTKKLSGLLIDLKVVKEERDTIPLLASDQEVLWVEGLATDIRVQKDKPVDPDIHWMKLALEQAQFASAKGELPVGAVLVKNNEIMATAHNLTETNHDPSAHAEVLSIRETAKKLGDWRLTECTLYVTLEPCPMCFGTMLQAHLPKLVYGAANHLEGACGSVTDLRDADWKRKIEVRSGVLDKECSRLLTDFFAKRR